MSEETVILHGAPTLAGIKTGSLFRCEYANAEEMRVSLRKWNQRFSAKGIRVMPLLFRDGKALLYLYRPARLSHDLSDHYACKMLSDCGYCKGTPARCLSCLAKRIQSGEEFPHEIGLFLGYPPEDVRGFILHKGYCCKYCGCWKVYGNEEKARCAFAKYKKCSDIYYSKWLQESNSDGVV